MPIGKESRLAEEAYAGAVSAEAMDTIYDIAGRPGREESQRALLGLQAILPILRPVPRKWLAKHAHVSELSGILRAVLNERKRPGLALGKRLVEIADAVQQANGDLLQAAALLQDA